LCFIRIDGAHILPDILVNNAGITRVALRE
jgi:hypothetical protein